MATILLVEDDELVRDMLAQLLERAQYKVICANDGEDASRILKSVHPDVMITDIVMPKKSGITLITEAKEEQPEIEIIAISGGGRLDPVGYLDLSEQVGAAASFEKPIDNAALLLALDLILKGRKENPIKF